MESADTIENREIAVRFIIMVMVMVMAGCNWLSAVCGGGASCIQLTTDRRYGSTRMYNLS